MCASDPFYVFNISPERLARAQAALDPKGPIMSAVNEQQFMEIMFEIGLADGIALDEAGKFTMNLTDLQIVAVVASLSAVVEGGCKQILQERHRDPGADIFTIH